MSIETGSTRFMKSGMMLKHIPNQLQIQLARHPDVQHLKAEHQEQKAGQHDPHFAIRFFPEREIHAASTA